MRKFIQIVEEYQYEMFPPDKLYHTTSPASAFEILKSRKVKPKNYEAFVSFSIKPHLYDIQGSGAVLVFDLKKIYSQLEPVEYDLEWATSHSDQVRYIAGEGWQEQFNYEDSDDEEDEFHNAELDAFLSKSNEDEWISTKQGQAVNFSTDAVLEIILDHVDDFTKNELNELGYDHIAVRQKQ